MRRAAAEIMAALVVLSALAGCRPDDGGHMVGTLERDRVELTVEANEPILAIPVTDGDEVAAGQVILRQDPARFEARLARQEALRDQSAARLAELRRGPRPERIREARARLRGDEASTRNARADLERARDIFDRGLLDAASLDDAKSGYVNAVAREEASREALESLLNGTTVEELEQAEAALRAAEADLRQARLDVARLTVTAPLAGTVDKVLYEQGERPVPGVTVAVLLDDSRPYARIYVPEPRRAQIQPGLRVNVKLDGHPELLPGTVRWVSSDASFTPYFALTEHDRSRLSYLAEVDVPAAADLPSGLPLEVWPE